ncbi:MAG: hypothetical protein WC718_07420 [Phycisphaerales bacterium]|jgi:hypothetical protein
MPTLADGGVPMLMVYEPVLLAALIPIVVVEAAWIAYRGRVHFWRVLRPVTKANVYSALAGVPLTWLALTFLTGHHKSTASHSDGWGNFILQVPILEHDPFDLHWTIPAAGLVISLPFCAASVLVEWLVLRHRLIAMGVPRVGRLLWEANLLSYTLIAVYWLVELLNASGPR